MPARKRSVQQEIDDATLPIVPGRKTKTGKQTLLDPNAPLPGALKRVGPKPPKTEKQQEKADPKHLRQRFAQYCKELAASAGNPVPALAVVFEISYEEARERQIELHQEITRAVNAMSIRDMMDMQGLSKQHRIARLGMFMYSDHPGASMKAMEMLNDLDGSSKSSGESWEEWAALAMGKRAS